MSRWEFLRRAGVMLVGSLLANSGSAALLVAMLVGALGALMADNTSYWVGRLGSRAFRPVHQETE